MSTAALLVLAAGAALAGPAAAPKIVNGEEESGYDFTVALGATFGEQTFSACTGSIITPRMVLSAGHCGEGIPPELIVSAGKAFFGPSVEEPTHVLAFEGFAIHPDYVPLENGLGGTLGENDVSVLILAEDAPVPPVWLRSTEVLDDELGAEMVSIGFGVTGPQGNGSGVKRSATLFLSDLDEMFLYSESEDNPNEAQICSGDSGGPQVVHLPDGRIEQWAVHSWGDQGCEIVSGSTRVDVVYDWILEQVEAVHGTTDFCEINGAYGNGTCDTFCGGEDPDCFEDEVVADGEGDDEKGRCSTVPLGAALGPAALAGLLALGRRRR